MKQKINGWNLLKMLASGLVLILLSACTTITEKQAFTFVQICDTQLGMGGYEHDVEMFERAVVKINALNPDFVVICGDLVHDRNDKSFADFKEIKADLTVPCYCVPGNHDVGNEPTAESLKKYREVIGDDTYSFEHKGYTFVFVNTQLWKSPVEGETEQQDVWLTNTLQTAAQKNRPVFVVGHYPLFLNAPDEADEYMNLPLVKRGELLELYERSGVVAVLGGHAHRLIISDYNGIQMVNGETTSKNFDQRPMGFRIWHINDVRPYVHEFITLE